VFKDRLDDVGVIVDTELIGDGQEERVTLCDGFVFCELLDEGVRLRGGLSSSPNNARTGRVRKLAAVSRAPLHRL